MPVEVGMSHGMMGGRGGEGERGGGGKRNKLQQTIAVNSFDIQDTVIENLQEGRSVT